MKNIPIYTIYEASVDANGDIGLGHKCVITSDLTKEGAFAQMREIAKNQTAERIVHVLENPELGEGPMIFTRWDGKFARWVVQEFLTVPDNVNL